MQQGLESGENGAGQDIRTFHGWMNAVLLDGVRHMDEVFVDHGDKRGVVFRSNVAEDLIEGMDVVRAVVGRKGDSSEQDFDVRAFKRCEHLVEVAAGLVER